MRKGGEETGERAAIGAIKMEKRGIDGVGCPPLLLRWNFSGQAQPVTRDNPAANELKSRRGFLLAQGELVCKPRNSPRSVRVSMIFTVPRLSPSSSRFYSPVLFARLPCVGSKIGVRRYSATRKVWERWTGSYLRNDRRRMDRRSNFR